MEKTNQYYMEIPRNLDPHEQQMMIELEKDAFPGLGAVDEQTLVPLARYGRIMLYREQGDARPIGVCECMRDFEDPGKAYIFGYYVRSDQKGKGIGTTFMQEVIRELQKDGFRSICLTVSESNTAAVRLYENAGFVIKEERTDEFGKGEHRLYMELTFSEHVLNMG